MTIKNGFAIIIPVKEINDYIRDSVPRTLQLDYPDFEIIILPNELPEKLEPCLQDPRVKVIRTGKVSPAVKRDMGAESTQYRWLAFLDDDAYPQRDWLRHAEKLFETENVQGLGGPGITPEENSLRQHASGLFYETYVGGGGMDYRYKPGKRDRFIVDDYPTVNLIVERQAFLDVGGFDNNYWPGEDTKFCLDFTNRGYKILYSKDLIVWHHRRNVFAPHLKQVGNYGLHRGYFAKRFPKTSARVVYFIPSAFFAAHAVMLIIWGALGESAVVQGISWAFALALVSYFVLAAVDVFKRTKDVRLGILTVVTVYLSHLYYGFMFLRGLLSIKHLRSQLR